MGKITSISELDAAIESLKIEQEIKGQLLREEFFSVSESLKPINLLKSTFREGASSLNLFDSILGTVVGVAAGSLTRKVFVGASAGVIRKVMGSAFQLGVTNIVRRNTKAIKTFGRYITQRIFNRKEENSGKL
jgi:hypothetical protein